ncbi:MAG: CDGSH iron-sulfur domain-containing protein [Rikenellaceae bacterium]
MKDPKTMVGSTPAPKNLHITVTNKGPYLVYGAPKLHQQFITVNESGESREYRQGAEFSTEEQPTALCRCGRSKGHPYCDSSHIHAAWDPTLTAPNDSLLSHAEIIEGEELTLVDNERYCVYARFCHPLGGTWRLTEESGNPEARKEAIRQASLCPSSRLTAWAKDADAPYELKFEPSLGLLEDPAIGASSGLWVRGGVTISKESGEKYEVRNRVVVCRCGSSHNKPFCDGSHAQHQWSDNIGDEVDINIKEVVEVY